MDIARGADGGDDLRLARERAAEILGGDLERAVAREDEIASAVRAAGYSHAVVDREPFRSGRLNTVLRRRLPA